jgi:Spy/CpxP family protein refolding chaperone
MKKYLRIIGMLMVLAIAGGGALYAQRGARGARGISRPADTLGMRTMNRRGDSIMMRRRNPGMMPGIRGMGPVNAWRDSSFMHRGRMYGMYGGMRHMPMNRMRPGMRNYPYYGFQRGMRPGNFYGQGPWQQRSGFGRIDNIPNLTDKQKKEISDLRQKQQDEMKKFRDETSARIQDMRKEHREKIMNILTDEQKKYLEERNPSF